MPVPLLPIIGAALAGGAMGVILTKAKDSYDDRQYDVDGYDNHGFDSQGFDRDGYNKKGFDREGYNRDGYDSEGFARDGYNADGFDRNGFDCDGYNAEGFDRGGLDRDGRDKDGFDQHGFDSSGRNRKGYDREGWNEQGRDVTGHDAGYYATCASEIKARLAKAEEFIAAGDCEHASLEIRIGAEQAVKCIVSHTLGIGRYRRHFESDINSCSGALSEEMIGKLHTLRRTCGDQLHISMRDVDGLHIDAKYVENLQNKLRFCMKVLEEALSVVEGYASDSM